MEILRDYALRLYMAGETQKSIARRAALTEATVCSWAKKDGWEQKRREQNSSSITLVNSLKAASAKISEKIVAKLEGDCTDGEIANITKLSDNISKLIAAAMRIDKNITKSDAIDVMIDYENYLQLCAQTDKELTPDLIATVNHYAQEYVKHLGALEDK